MATVCLIGTAVAVLVMHPHIRAAAPEQVVALRGVIADLSNFIFLPSLAVVLVSGLAAMAVNSAYHEAAWAWLKALSGVALFEGALIAEAGNAAIRQVIDSTEEPAAQVSAIVEIVADAQQWTARNVPNAGGLDHQHARLPVGKAAIPVEHVWRDEAVVGRAPWHHRRHPSA